MNDKIITDNTQMCINQAKEIKELKQQLKATQLQRQDYCDSLNQYKELLTEQVAYSAGIIEWITFPPNAGVLVTSAGELKKAIQEQPSLQQLNKLKADAIREAANLVFNQFNKWGKAQIFLNQLAEEMEKGEDND